MEQDETTSAASMPMVADPPWALAYLSLSVDSNVPYATSQYRTCGTCLEDYHKGDLKKTLYAPIILMPFKMNALINGWNKSHCVPMAKARLECFRIVLLKKRDKKMRKKWSVDCMILQVTLCGKMIGCCWEMNSLQVHCHFKRKWVSKLIDSNNVAKSHLHYGNNVKCGA